VPRRAKAPPRAKVAQTSNRRLRSKTKAPTSPRPAVRAVASSRHLRSRTRALTSPRPAVRAVASSRHLRSRAERSSSKRPLSRTRASTNPRPAVRAVASSRHLHSRTSRPVKTAATNNVAVVNVPFEQTSPASAGLFLPCDKCVLKKEYHLARPAGGSSQEPDAGLSRARRAGRSGGCPRRRETNHPCNFRQPPVRTAPVLFWFGPRHIEGPANAPIHNNSGLPQGPGQSLRGIRGKPAG
jgi:hypothetical protein